MVSSSLWRPGGWGRGTGCHVSPSFRAGLQAFLISLFDRYDVWGTKGWGSHLGEGPGGTLDETGRGSSLQADWQRGCWRDPSELCWACGVEAPWRVSCGWATSSPCLQAVEVRLSPIFIKHFAFQRTRAGSCREGGPGVAWKLGGQLGEHSYGRLSKTSWLVCPVYKRVCLHSELAQMRGISIQQGRWSSHKHT